MPLDKREREELLRALDAVTTEDDRIRVPTRTYVVEGHGRAHDCTRALINASRWFEFTPLPDDEYRIVVKDELGAPSPFTVDEVR